MTLNNVVCAKVLRLARHKSCNERTDVSVKPLEELKEVLRPEFLSEDDTLQKLLKIFNSLQKKFVRVCCGVDLPILR